MGTVVLDTSVLVGLLDPEDASHDQASRALHDVRRARHQVVLPASALAELLVGAGRLGPAAGRTIDAFVDAIVDRVCDVDPKVVRAAVRYLARHRFLRLPDAMVLAVGQVLRADTVLTADAQWSRADRRVQVLPPLPPGEA
jgi:predicted nucleic acid-binding protein